MIHDEFCRFANDDRIKKHKVCFDCQRLQKARQQEREKIANEKSLS